MSRREQIRMSPGEVDAFLDAQLTVTVGTNGRDGFPHLMPLWYVLREAGVAGRELWAWTYAASQKVRNLERDPRATLQVETGGEYHLLRGVMLKTEVRVHRDEEVVAGVGLDVFVRHGGQAASPELREMIARQAPKRVALQFVERERASWDHRKLGEVY